MPAGVVLGRDQHSITGASAAPYQAELRNQRNAAAVHRLGARVFYEFVADLIRKGITGEGVWERLAQYSRLDPDHILICGADAFPPSIWLVPEDEP